MQTNTNEKFDYLFIGSGISGLSLAALLAKQGKRVCIVERHYNIGGYSHSFHKQSERGDYTFCGGLHYLCNCLNGGDGERLMNAVGLGDEVRFQAMDPAGFDRSYFPGLQYNFVHGIAENVERLSAMFPESREGIERFFSLCDSIYQELLALPLEAGYIDVLRHPVRFSHLIRYRNWTVQDLFDSLCLPKQLQAILSTQAGDLALPPNQLSLFSYGAFVAAYVQGACVPEKGYEHLIQSLVGVILHSNGCRILTRTEVVGLDTKYNQVCGVRTSAGQVFTADHYILNGDPKQLRTLVGEEQLPSAFNRRLAYNYSASGMLIFVGLKDIDLRQYGFGNSNLWHFPGFNLNEIYESVYTNHDLSGEPGYFISTPSLDCKKPLSPEGCQQMTIVTLCPYAYISPLLPSAYEKEKKRLADRILTSVEKHYIPSLHEHIDLVDVGTPRTCERFAFAPQGNVYGMSQTPQNIRIGKLGYQTPYSNLFLCNSCTGLPGFAGCVHTALQMFEKLTGKSLSN